MDDIRQELGFLKTHLKLTFELIKAILEAHQDPPEGLLDEVGGLIKECVSRITEYEDMLK